MAKIDELNGAVDAERTIDIYGSQDGTTPINTLAVNMDTGEIVEILGADKGAASQLKFDIIDGKITSITDEHDTKLKWEMIGDYDYPLFLWEDENIFTDEVKQTFLHLPDAERPQFVVEVFDAFYRKNIEFANFIRVRIYKDPTLLLDFYQSIKKSDFKKCGIEDKGRFKILQARLKEAEIEIARRPMDPDKLNTIWPVLRIRESLLTESELAALYYLKNPKATGTELAEILEEVPETYNIPFGNYLFATADLMAHIAAKRDLYYEVTKGGRRKSDRHKQVSVRTLQKGYEVTQTKKGEVTSIAVLNKDLIKSTAAMKLFIFLLAKANQQHFSPIITFSLQELVNNGMYSHIENARQGFKNHIAAVQSLQIAGEMKKGKRNIKQHGGVLFYNHEIDNNIVKVSVNENFDIEFLASYYTKLPAWAWSLSNNAFELLLYIFMKARAERNAKFNVSLSIVREKLALPTKEEYTEKNKKWKPAQYVKEPITAAVQNIIDVAKQNQDENIVIEPHYVINDRDLEEWLNGFIAVQISGDYSEIFESITQKRTKLIEANTRRKEEARAAAEAKKEAEKNQISQ